MSLDELIENNRLEPEVEKGNIEYKLKLTHSEKELPFKIEELTSQMKWRIHEGFIKSGKKCAYYFLGLNDDGTIGGVDVKIINQSLKVLRKVIKCSSASIDSTHISMFNDGVVAMVKISIIKNSKFMNEFRVIMLGDTNSGKSSIIGSLTYDIKDDGHGCSRHNLFQYQHEHDTGQTSSIKCEISGFTKNKNSFLNYTDYFEEPWENLFKCSDGIINFIDLPGDIKYLKTTLFGIMSYIPHILIIVIDINDVASNITNIIIDKTNEDSNDSDKNEPNLFEYFDSKVKKYLDICYNMQVQSFIVLNKMDLIEENKYNYILEKFAEYIKYTYSKQTCLLTDKYENYDNNNDVNIVPFSCVTHNNIGLLKQFLMNSTSFINLTDNQENSSNNHYLVNDWMYIPEIGPVISGTMITGSISIHDKLLIGPFGKSFYNIKVQSIHKKQVLSDTMFCGESGSMVVELLNTPGLDNSNILNKIDKHLSIITSNRLHYFVHKFEIISTDPVCNKITTGSQYTIFTMNIMDAALVQNIEKINDNMYKITFMFVKLDILRYIYNGSNVIFRKDNDIYFGKCYQCNQSD